MGREGAQSAERSIGLVDDPALQQYVSQLGLAMARTSERPDLPWQFGVVDDPTPNAFALPGGFIYVTRGLLGLMNSEAELASVLGHEIGHVTARHSVSMISRAQLATIGLGVGMILMPDLARFGELAGGGLQLLFLSYGRDAERQADDLGFKYAYQHGYDVRDMVNVFGQLERAGEAAGQSPLPAWLSSHPFPAERMQRIGEKIAELPQPVGGQRGTEAYMARIDGLVYGANPRNGFFRDALFLHPDLRFQLRFPQGWRTQNLAESVSALSPQQDAVIQLTIAEGTIDAAANSFFGRQGIRSGQVGRTTINGMSAVTGRFEAQTDQGTLAGNAAFISWDNRTYQILAYAAASNLSRYDSTLRATIGSFDRLTDASALNVRPDRIAVIRTTESMTVTEFNRRHPSAVEIAELALINALAGPESVIPAGTRVKRVVAGQ